MKSNWMVDEKTSKIMERTIKRMEMMFKEMNFCDKIGEDSIKEFRKV